MTTGIAAIYIVLMVLGLLWVIVRMVSYVRSQREMRSRWDQALYDEGFKEYLEKLKEENSVSSDADPSQDKNEKSSGDEPTSGTAAD